MTWEPDKGYEPGMVVKHEGELWVACFPGKDGLVHGEPGKVRGWELF